MPEPRRDPKAEREIRLVELARYRVKILGDRVRDLNRWDADYAMRRAARDARRER